MFPFLEFSIDGHDLAFPTSWVLIICFALLAMGAWVSLFRSWVSLARAVWIVSLTLLATLTGGRLTHVLWERPDLLSEPLQIFTRFDGMVFYGGLFFGVMTLWVCIRRWIPREHHALVWDRTALICALGVGILRVSCFASGCCWGKLSGLPWAVRYFHPHSLMPYRGIPVHPVQLYDSASGWMILLGLMALKRRIPEKTRGLLLPIFLATYAIGRFLTEFLRGDSFRRSDLLFSLSTSQWISVSALIVALFYLRSRLSRPLRLPLRSAALLTAIPFLGTLGPGCVGSEAQLLSQAFQSNVHSIAIRSDGSQEFTFHPSGTHGKNLIFIAADRTIQWQLQEKFQGKIATPLGSETPLTLEELAWRATLPSLQKIYDSAIRVTEESVRYSSVLASIEEIERRQVPYDLIFLTHGFPNHLSSGTSYFFSYQEIEKLQGTLSYLHLVFMQGCYSDSLADDWLQSGAKAVLGFSGLNRNYFFFGLFLPRYAQSLDIERAYWRTVERQNRDLRKSSLYRALIEAMGLTVEQYLENAEPPLLRKPAVARSHS